MKVTWSYLSMLVVWVAVVVVGLNHFIDRQGTWPFAIGWDSYGYYLYLPAQYPYADNDAFAFTEAHRKDYKVSSTIYQISTHDGETLPIYTIGMAILYSPGYVAGHVIAVITGQPQDGLSLPYQWSVIVWSWIVAFIGLFFLRKLLLLHFRDSVVAATILVLGLGTNLFNYWSHEPTLTHAWLFTCYAILLYLITRWYSQPKFSTSVALGALAALIALIRPSEAILILLFALYGIEERGGPIGQLRYWQQHAKYLTTIIISGLLVVSIQILYWYLHSGKLWHNAYIEGGHHFDFASPHIVDGLLSWRKGWLIYTPAMAVSLVGLFFKKRYKAWHLAIILFTVINIYIVLSWHMWWYAGSFGQRALVQSYAMLAIPMAAVFSIANKRRWSSIALGIFVGLCIVLNQWQHYQYRHKILPQDGITKTFYRASFLKGTLDKSLRVYLNSDEKAPAKLSPATTIAAQDLSDTTNFGDLTIGGQKPYSETLKVSRDKLPEAGSWINISATLLALSDTYGQYDGAKLVAEIKDNGDANKWTGVEVQKIIEPTKAQTINFDFRMPETLTEKASLQVMLWNQSPDSIYFSSIKVEALR